MSTAILTDYDNLFINDGNTDFAIVPATPNPHGSTKIKRWWGSSYESTTYASCAVIEIADSFIIVDCDKAVRLKMIKGESSLSFSVGFDKPGDGNINRILVCPKTDLHALVNYDDYYYDYGSKQIVHTQFGTGGIVLQVTDITYTIQIGEGLLSFTLRSAGTVDYTVNWGDGSSPEDSTSNILSHTYASTGSYEVKITINSGSYRPSFNDSGDEDQITSVDIGFTDPAKFGTSLFRAFKHAGNMTQYNQPATATSAVTDLAQAWQDCRALTSFPLIDTSSTTNFGSAWAYCRGLTSFPVLDTSNGTIFASAWRECRNISAFPALDFSNATNVSQAWRTLPAITEFPSCDFSNVTTFERSWDNGYNLRNYPANQFDTTGTLVSNAFNAAFSNCRLTVQSMENILTSLDTNGQQNITLGISGHLNANASTWSYSALDAFINLTNKGWTITKNGDAGIAYTINNSGTSFTLRSQGTVNYTVDWGDGSSLETSTSNTLAHTYASSGTYVVKINSNSGATYSPRFDNSSDEDQIISVAVGFASGGFFSNLGKAFTGAQNMTQYNQVAAASSGVNNFSYAWNNCSGLTSFPLIDTGTNPKFREAWRNCSGLTSFPLIDTTGSNDFRLAWQNCSGLTSFPLIDTSSATSLLTQTWSGCSGLTSFPLIDTSNATTIKQVWMNCSSLATFPLIDTSNVSNFEGTWSGCNSLTSFPLIDTSNGTNFRSAWSHCSGLTVFPVLDTSSGTNFISSWSDCTFSTFPVLDVSSGTDFGSAWKLNPNLNNFPTLDFSSATNFNNAWRSTFGLTTFPPNQFDITGTLTSNAFQDAWRGGSLNAQSIENVVTSLDRNGAQGINLDLTKGTNALSIMADASTWSTDAIISYRNLINKSWTIAQRGTPSMSDLEYTISNSGTSFTLRSTGTVNYTVDWGDGSSLETSTSNTLAHTYASSGTYVVKINSNSGATYRPYFYGSGDEDQIISIAIGSEDSAEFSTNIQRAFKDAQNMTKYNQVAAATSAVTNFRAAWGDCSGLTSFPLIDTSSATSINNAWNGCSGLTSFPVLDTSNVTDFGESWEDCSGLTSFPALDTSSGTGLTEAWRGCSGLTSFPVLDVSSGTNFERTWIECSSLASFPSLNFSSGTRFKAAWRDCTSLSTYPAGQFNSTGTLASNAFELSWFNSALTAQSIENILTSLDTNGASNITLGINGGTNANASTWTYSALDAFINLTNKGWTITKNGDAGIAYTINTSGTFTLRSGNSNYTVDWGDGSSLETSTSTVLSHTYPSSGTYVVKISVISGARYGPLYNGNVAGDEITSVAISSFHSSGSSPLNTMERALKGCQNMTQYNQVAAESSAVTNLRETWESCSGLTTFPLIDTSSVTNFNEAWNQCSGLTSFPLIDTSSGTNFGGTWNGCSGITTFPQLDTSSGTAFNATWNGCTGLTTFPVLDTSSGTNFSDAWKTCTGLTSFPALDTSSGTNFTKSWEQCTGLTTFPVLDTSSGTNFSSSWNLCSGLTSFPLIDVSSGTNFSYAWRGCTGLTSFPLIDTSSATILQDTWSGCSSLTSFPSIDSSSATNLKSAWFGCNSLTSFPLINTSNATTLQGTWNGCNSLTSFPLINSSSCTNFFKTWYGCNSLTSFPQIDTSAGVDFRQTWAYNADLDNISNLSGATTSFPLIDTSNGTDFEGCWVSCSSLVSFPALDFSSATTLKAAWKDCGVLTTFPANLFDSTGTLTSTAFFNTWQNCDLTAQSIENILTSLDTNGAQNISLVISGGQNAAKTTWSTAANTAYNNLVTKGWTITYNA